MRHVAAISRTLETRHPDRPHVAPLGIAVTAVKKSRSRAMYIEVVDERLGVRSDAGGCRERTRMLSFFFRFGIIELVIVAAMLGIPVLVTLAVLLARRGVPRDRPNLAPCPDCGRAVSVRAERCPHCGCPFKG